MRSTENSEETFYVELDLYDSVENLPAEILEVIGLQIKAGISSEEAKRFLGEPESSKRSRRNQTSWYEFKSEQPEPYLITCVFQDDKGLCSVKIQRLDIDFPKSEDELYSPPSNHQMLDEFEVLPENITSPESPVSKVRLLLESSGNFRYLIHVRPQIGVVVEAATLMIRNSISKIQTTIIDLHLSAPNTNNGVIELSGHIDKEFLFRTFIRLSMKDEIHNTSQYVFVEFDQWYGKFV